MKSTNKQSEFFNNLNQSLDSVADLNQINQLSKIEIDLIKEKLRKIYDLVSEIPMVEPVVQKEVELEVEVANEISPVVIEEKIQESETDPTEIESEVLLPPGIEIKDETKQPDRSTADADLFSVSEIKSVVDVISETVQNESIADKIQKQTKVDNLKNAIGINEKFFFINELFDGNLNEYNTAIDSLDKFDLLEESMSFLDEFSKKHNWGDKPDAFEQLKQFVDRKFK